LPQTALQTDDHALTPDLAGYMAGISRPVCRVANLKFTTNGLLTRQMLQSAMHRSRRLYTLILLPLLYFDALGPFPDIAHNRFARNGAMWGRKVSTPPGLNLTSTVNEQPLMRKTTAM